MAVASGDRIPDVEIKTMGADGLATSARTGEVLGSDRAVLFAVPGACTLGCSKIHLQGFVERADGLKAKGVDTIACVAVNDAFVMDAWGKEHDVGEGSKRYAAIIEDGVVTSHHLRCQALTHTHCGYLPGKSRVACATMVGDRRAGRVAASRRHVEPRNVRTPQGRVVGNAHSG